MTAIANSVMEKLVWSARDIETAKLGTVRIFYSWPIIPNGLLFKALISGLEDDLAAVFVTSGSTVIQVYSREYGRCPQCQAEHINRNEEH